jgi:ubiquinone/menaquinone biosynthesis C-methylase UbiE
MSDFQPNNVRLELLPLKEYAGVDEKDPIKLYNLPIIGRMYQRRIELCLSQLKKGNDVLEIGFGSGVSFLNLQKIFNDIYGLDLTADVVLISNFFAKKGVMVNLKNGNILDLPYPDNSFDSVLLISILEHLKPEEQELAFSEIRRVLRPGGQVVYGVPVERPFMVFMFRLLGTDIRTHHFSTEKDVFSASSQLLKLIDRVKMFGPFGLFGQVYEVCHFQKSID